MQSWGIGLVAFFDDIVMVSSGFIVTWTRRRLAPSILCFVAEFSLGVRGVTAPQLSCQTHEFDTASLFQCGF